MSKTFTLTFLLFLSTHAWSQAGIPNPQFAGGAVVTPFGSGDCQANDLAVQPDGKIIAVGYATISGFQCGAIARYKSDGGLDPTFGNNGLVTVTPNSLSCQFSSVILLPNGKILAGGFIVNGSTVQFALMRFLSNGGIDHTFGNNGLVTLLIGMYSYIKDVMVQPDGRIVVVGETLINGDYDFVVARYLPHGWLDITFSGGLIVVDFEGDDYVSAARLQADGKIVIAGTSHVSVPGGGAQFALTRIEPNGEIDNEFGINGKVTTVVGAVPGGDFAMSLAIQEEGQIVVAGESRNPPFFSDIAIVRYDQFGTIDPTFGNSGVVIDDLDGASDQAKCVSIQNDGKILVAANSTIMNHQFVVIKRYSKDGDPDPSFGVGGYSKTYFGDDSYVNAMQFRGHNIYVAGVVQSNPTHFALASFVNDVAPLPVDLLDFTAHKDGGSVVLEWSTEHEINTHSFVVEKSTDGRNYSVLTEVPAVGNSSSIQRYKAIDRDVLDPVIYYRLRIIDLDGSFDFSQIVVIKNQVKAIEIFPNPVRSTAQIIIPGGNGENVKIEVFDLTGKLARSLTIRSGTSALSVPIDFSSLLKGVYIVRLSSSAQTFSTKILKE